MCKDRPSCKSQRQNGLVRRATAGKPIDSFGKARKSHRRTGTFSMRGILMALFALDFPGHRVAGGTVACLSSTKTTAKKATVTTV
jgi:hypothetical protein